MKPVNSPIKGRGTGCNPSPRYAPLTTEKDEPDPDDAPDAYPETEFLLVKAKSIIATNKSPDLPFSKSINPYQGCEHGCIYCYARPTHAYWDLSPGLDFERKIQIKENAPEQLREALSKPGYRCAPIALGTNTDPYQPAERTHELTRRILEVLIDFNHPFTITTKSQLVLRDLDLLRQAALRRLCLVHISVTTLDNELKRKLEPRTASPGARLRTLQSLSEAGVPAGVLVAPIIPKINDHELEAILSVAKSSGAQTAGYIFIRLPKEVSPLFQDWLTQHYPLKATHVMSLIRQSRNGQDYEAKFGSRMSGEGLFAGLLKRRFEVSCLKLGLNTETRPRLDTSRFSVRPVTSAQLSLFD